MAVGVRADLERHALESAEEYELEVVTVEELAAQYEPTPWDDAYHPGPLDNDELLARTMPWARDWQLGYGAP